MYSNSKSVKDALQKWGGKREDLFILQKCEYITPATFVFRLTDRR